MSESYDVLCVGAVNHDAIALVSALPADDERMVADDIVVGHGGPAAQAAVTLARLGHAVALCSSVGDDSDGAAIIAGLEAEGVDTRFVRTVPGSRTPRTIVLANTTTGERSIVTSAYRSSPVDPPIDLAPIVHVDQVGFPVVDERLRRGEPGGRLSLDAGNPVSGLSLERVWLYAPTRVALERDLGAEPGESLDALAERALASGPERVVVTDGPRGSWWYEGAAVTHVGAIAIEVVSSLGAGDVFHGALISAMIDGRTPEDALLWANTCAALSCRAVDGRSGIPHRAELEATIAKRDRPVPGGEGR